MPSQKKDKKVLSISDHVESDQSLPPRVTMRPNPNRIEEPRAMNTHSLTQTF